MEQKLLHAVIHKLNKAAGTPTQIIEAENCLNVADVPLQDLVNQVNDVYSNREAKSYGKFDPDLTAVSAEPHLQYLRDNKDADFLEKSKSLMTILKDKAEAQNFATGGHVLIYDYSVKNVRLFVVAILNSAAGTMVDESLRVVQAPHLDVDGLRFAGRVNFTDWTADTDRYISFLRGKGHEVSQYFQRFLGCSAVQQDLSDTRNMVQVVKKFAAAQELSDERREKLFTAVNQFAVQCAKAKPPIPISLAELANRTYPENPEALRSAFAQADSPIPDGFIPKTKGLSGLVRFSTKTGKWKLEFEREVIQNGTIQFDPVAATLTITALPPEVIKDLTQEFLQDAQEDTQT
ncbi:MAG: nucleoid-associated protein [Azoarcus sp.]|jgi:nucleoid-associated protein|nr:nucleoid-associated protein [Azoarcus sp.]